MRSTTCATPAGGAVHRASPSPAYAVFRPLPPRKHRVTCPAAADLGICRVHRGTKGPVPRIPRNRPWRAGTSSPPERAGRLGRKNNFRITHRRRQAGNPPQGPRERRRMHLPTPRSGRPDADGPGRSPGCTRPGSRVGGMCRRPAESGRGEGPDAAGATPAAADRAAGPAARPAVRPSGHGRVVTSAAPARAGRRRREAARACPRGANTQVARLCDVGGDANETVPPP